MIYNLAKRKKPDLIICDIEMPSVDGGDVARAIFDDEDTKNIPLLFLLLACYAIRH
ncbi:MAG: response regulator [Desulfamplus sp.]|nr:response regulator [Desulfamplus sp.]